MTTQVPPVNDHAWEKELAPRITRRKLVCVAGIYCLWLGFLAVLAAIRWFGSLQ